MATGGVLIKPSDLIVKLTQEPIDHFDEFELQLKPHNGDWIVGQYILWNATQNFELAVIFSTFEIWLDRESK